MRIYSIVKAKSAGFDLAKTNFGMLFDTFCINAHNKNKVNAALSSVGRYIRTNILKHNSVEEIHFSISNEGSVTVNDTFHNRHKIHTLDVTLTLTASLDKVVPEALFTCKFITANACGNADLGSKHVITSNRYPVIDRTDVSRLDVAIGKLHYTGQTNNFSIVPTHKHGVISTDMWAQINHLAKYIRMILKNTVNNSYHHTIYLVQYTDDIHTTKSSGSRLNCQLTFSVNYRLR